MTFTEFFNEAKKIETYRIENARKVNAKRFPDGFIYIIAIEEHDLYKIGVSKNPKRRIRDITTVIPFECKVIFLKHYKKVYELEELIHNQLKDNTHQREWFKLYKEDVVQLKTILKEVYNNETILK